MKRKQRTSRPDVSSHIDPRLGFPAETSTCGPQGNHSDNLNHFDGEVMRCKVCGEIMWATREYRAKHPELKTYK
jgi:hypothetical protein